MTLSTILLTLFAVLAVAGLLAIAVIFSPVHMMGAFLMLGVPALTITDLICNRD